MPGNHGGGGTGGEQDDDGPIGQDNGDIRRKSGNKNKPVGRPGNHGGGSGGLFDWWPF